MSSQLRAHDQSSFFSSGYVPEDTISVQIPIRNISAARALEQYLLSLTDEGYLGPEIISVDSSQTDVLFVNLKKNSRHILDSIQINDGGSKELIHIGSWFSPSKIQIVIDNRIDAYIRQGYPFVRFDQVEFHVENDTVRVRVDVDKGSYVTIRTMTFTGNSKLSGPYLIRESGFRPGMEFDPVKIDAALINLLRSRFLVDVRAIGIREIEDHYEFIVHVDEIASSRVNVIAGYEPSTLSDNRFTGQMDLSLNNAIAEGSAFDLNYRRISSSTSRLDVKYEQEWVGGWPVGIALYSNIHQRDSTFNTILLSTKATYTWRSSLSTGLYLIYGKTNSSGGQLTQVALDNRSFILGGIIDINELNRRINPTSGYRLMLDISTGLKRILNANDLSVDIRQDQIHRRVRIDLSHFIALSNNIVISQSVQAAHLNGMVFWEDDVFRFGGANSLRGYREDQFQSVSFVWTDHEIRYLLDRFSYIFLFGAVGIDRYTTSFGVFRPEMDRTLLYAGGAGLSYRIRLGALKLTYAVGREDSFLNGKIHFGITNSF